MVIIKDPKTNSDTVQVYPGNEEYAFHINAKKVTGYMAYIPQDEGYYWVEFPNQKGYHLVRMKILQERIPAEKKLIEESKDKCYNFIEMLTESGSFERIFPWGTEAYFKSTKWVKISDSVK